MSLSSGYDMVLLPPRGSAEPRPEPIPPQSVRGRRSGHHAGVPDGGVRGLGSLTLPLRRGSVRPFPRIFLTRSPIPPARQALEEGPVEHQAPLHGPTGDHRDLLFRPDRRAKHGSRPVLRRGTMALDFSSPSIRGWSKSSGTSRAPSRTQEHSHHLCLFRKHFIKCVRGSSRALLKVYPGPYRYTTRFIVPRGSHLR